MKNKEIVNCMAWYMAVYLKFLQAKWLHKEIHAQVGAYVSQVGVVYLLCVLKGSPT